MGCSKGHSATCISPGLPPPPYCMELASVVSPLKLALLSFTFVGVGYHRVPIQNADSDARGTTRSRNAAIVAPHAAYLRPRTTPRVRRVIVRLCRGSVRWQRRTVGCPTCRARAPPLARTTCWRGDSRTTCSRTPRRAAAQPAAAQPAAARPAAARPASLVPRPPVHMHMHMHMHTPGAARGFVPACLTCGASDCVCDAAAVQAAQVDGGAAAEQLRGRRNVGEA